MVMSEHACEEVVTKEGGRNRNAVCEDDGQYFIGYMLPTYSSVSLLTARKKTPQALILWLSKTVILIR